jgi:hypothetical protein
VLSARAEVRFLSALGHLRKGYRGGMDSQRQIAETREIRPFLFFPLTSFSEESVSPSLRERLSSSTYSVVRACRNLKPRLIRPSTTHATAGEPEFGGRRRPVAQTGGPVAQSLRRLMAWHGKSLSTRELVVEQSSHRQSSKAQLTAKKAASF